MRVVIRQRIADTLAFQPPPLTRRDARIPGIPRKARAAVGIRRAKALLLTLTGSDVLAAKVDAPSKVTVRAAWEGMLDQAN
jgi:hypothetical protein